MPGLLVEGQVQDSALYWSWELSQPLSVSLWSSRPWTRPPLPQDGPLGTQEVPRSVQECCVEARQVTRAWLLPGRPPPPRLLLPHPARRQLQEARAFRPADLGAILSLGLWPFLWPCDEMSTEPMAVARRSGCAAAVPTNTDIVYGCKGRQEGPGQPWPLTPRSVETQQQQPSRWTGKDGEIPPRAGTRGGCSCHCYSVLSWGSSLSN